MSKISDMIGKIDLVSLMNIGRKKKKRNPHYAGFNRRMFAGTIDSMFLVLFEPLFDWLTPIHQEALSTINMNAEDPNLTYHFITQIFTNVEFMMSWVLNLGLQVLVFCLYSAVCWHFWANTPGKMLMRIKIVDVHTEAPITDRQIWRRCLGYFVSSFCFLLGFFWINIDKKHRGWHDRIAGTAVVIIPWKKKS